MTTVDGDGTTVCAKAVVEARAAKATNKVFILFIIVQI
jgi:hypothetical protein